MAALRPGILWFVLDDASSVRLQLAVPPRYSTHFYHHATLSYGVERSAVESLIGRQQTIHAYAVGYNDGAQAVRVRTHGLPDTYGVPHITVSMAAGIQPFASVAMLQGEHEESRLLPHVELTGTLQFVYIDELKS